MTTYANISIGDTVRVQNSDYRNGLIRKVIKFHHSGRYAYLEPGFNEHSAELYFHVNKLVKVPAEQLKELRSISERQNAVEVVRRRLAQLFTKDGLSPTSDAFMRTEAEKIVRDLDAAGIIG